MANHLHFTKDLIRLRWNQPALRGDHVNAFYADDANRVIAFQRWLDGEGRDVVIAATLSETTWFNYSIGFPSPGHWTEIFNSDLYENFPNPEVAGNGGGIDVNGPPMQGLPASAAIVIPANGFVVFARG
jgi:1,4-alpha-glucan branching enzyme